MTNRRGVFVMCVTSMQSILHRSRAVPMGSCVGVLAGGLLMGGCVGRQLTALADLSLAPAALAAVTGSPPVSLLAIGGTQQLSVTGLTFVGAPVTAFDSVLYQYNTPADSVRLSLSRTGLMTGLTTTPSTVQVKTLAFLGNAIRGDIVLVQVTPSVVSGLTLSIQPTAPDSTRLAAGSAKTIVPVLRNPTTSIVIANPAMEYRVRGADSLRLMVYRPQVTYTGYSGTDFLRIRTQPSPFPSVTNQIIALDGEGTAWIYATLSAYGTMLQDSVQYTFSYPFTLTISTVKTNLEVTSLYQGQTVTLAPGATVTLQNGVAATDPLTVVYTFDNPAAATAATSGGPSGNVVALSGGQTSPRKFLTTGTSHWIATTAGGPAPWSGQSLSGVITIK